MEQKLKELKNWLEKLSKFNLPDWNTFPNIDLYMDQVITYLDRELEPLSVQGQEKMITTSMINNYVKGEQLAPPIKKKYNRDHLAHLFAISSIKQVLSISDISFLFNNTLTEKKDFEAIYDFFKTTQKDIINSIADNTLKNINTQIENYQDISNGEFNNFFNSYILKLAIEAEAKKIVAEKLLRLMQELKDQVNNEAELDRERVQKEAKAQEESEQIKQLNNKKKTKEELSSKRN